MLAAVLAFAGVAAVINVTPGLDTMMVLRASVSRGRAAGFVTGLGINAGCLIWGLAAAAGVSELLVASSAAYTAMRIAGAAYLTWLGCHALWRSRRPAGAAAADAAGTGTALTEAALTEAGGTDAARTEAGHADGAVATGAGPASGAARPAAKAPRAAAFRAGLATNLLNPKAGVFYMSLLPQFIPRGAPEFGTALGLTMIDVAELLIWFCVVSAAAQALASRIGRAGFRRRMEQLTGVVFVGFAVGLVLDRGV